MFKCLILQQLYKLSDEELEFQLLDRLTFMRFAGLRTRHRLYLAIVLDLYSRAIVGWSLSKTINAQLVCAALTMSVRRRQMTSGLLIHGDRGSQYCSKDYQPLISDHKMKCSMSRKGNYWDNSVAESFFHTLKVEAVHGERFHTRDQLRLVP